MTLSDYPLYLAVFAVVLLSASGLGRLVLGPVAACGTLRASMAHALVGFLILSACFSAVLQLNLPFDAAVVGLGLLGVVGLAAWGMNLIRLPRDRRAPVAVWLTGVVLLAVVSWLPVDRSATDSTSYAFLTSTALHGEWVDANLAGTHIQNSAGTNAYFAGSRGAAVGLVWPWSALGWGIAPAMVGEVAQWLILVSLLLLIDLMSLSGLPLFARALLAAGGLAAFSEEAVLGGGQIGQAFGILAATAALWLDRHLLAGWARLLSLGLIGFGVATGYPEFLAALPLYLGCLYLLRPRGWRAMIAVGAAMLVGVLFAEVLTRGATLAYLLSQSQGAPGAQAFAQDPRNALDVWQWVVLQRPFSRWLFVLLAPLAVYAVWVVRRFEHVARRVQLTDWVVVGGLVALLGLLTWAVLRSGNPNYATFKMAAWVGPMLLLAGWAVAGLMRRRVRPVVAFGVMLLASYRTLGLVWSAASLTAANLPTASLTPEWQLGATSLNGRCALQLLQASPPDIVVERAIAESAAPRWDCSVVGL